MFKINPYRPGAGVRPQYLAGRDEDIENVTNTAGCQNHL